MGHLRSARAVATVFPEASGQRRLLGVVMMSSDCQGYTAQSGPQWNPDPRAIEQIARGAEVGATRVSARSK